MPRSYRLHLPPAAASGQALPLVLNLHGATQNGLLQEIQSGMDSTADQNGFLVAYPNGTKVSKVLTPDPVAGKAQYSWNAGVCCGLPVTKDVDDVGFLEQVIADIEAKTAVDPSRIYVTGMSAGGMMAYTMAAEDSGQIAAIASVSGQVELPSIDPTRPVPTMEFHSIDDPIAFWAGTAGAPGRGIATPSWRASVSGWRPSGPRRGPTTARRSWGRRARNRPASPLSW